MDEFEVVLTNIEMIRQASGHAKFPILETCINGNKLFKKVIQYTLDSSKTYKCSSVKRVSPTSSPTYLFDQLDFMNESRSITKVEKEKLARIASQSEAMFKVVNMILERKLRCGVDVKTINNLFPGIVPYFPYMRCSGLDKIKHLVFPCYSQLKADGEYFDVFCESAPIFQTRNGKRADFRFVDCTDIPIMNGKVMGEALMLRRNGDGFMSRKDGNAIINKGIYGLLTSGEAERIRFKFWDMTEVGYPGKSYSDRLSDMNIYQVPLIENKIIYDMSEAWDHYDEVRNRKLKGIPMKLEGTVLKNMNGLYEDGTSLDQFKLKAEKECELEIFDTVEGTGKYRGMVGSLRCRSSCGGLVTDVGMGLSDEDRARTDWAGEIISVKFNSVSKSKAKEHYALAHARLIEPRLDKTTADNLEYIKKVKEAKRR